MTAWKSFRKPLNAYILVEPMWRPATTVQRGLYHTGNHPSGERTHNSGGRSQSPTKSVDATEYRNVLRDSGKERSTTHRHTDIYIAKVGGDEAQCPIPQREAHASGDTAGRYHTGAK